MAADVLIIGAGIAGLTAAAALQQQGISVEIVERADALRVGGSGILLHPNALHALARIQVVLLREGCSISSQTSFAVNGSTTVVDWNDVWGDNGLPLGIHRRAVATGLLRRVETQTVRWSTEPTALCERDEHVEVTFTDTSVSRYRLVVGADGVNSWLRRYVEPAALPRYLGQIYWRRTAVHAAPHDFPDWCIWRAGGHFFGGMPIGAGQSHVFLQATHPSTDPSVNSRLLRELLLDLKESLGARVDILWDADAYATAAVEVTAARWTKGRLVLIGDAAHALSPSASQGGALAIEDAIVLADEVSKAGPTTTSLANFEQRRQPRVRRFSQHTRLHLQLMEAAQQRGGFSSNIKKSSTRTDATNWFRKLYEPLMEDL